MPSWWNDIANAFRRPKPRARPADALRDALHEAAEILSKENSGAGISIADDGAWDLHVDVRDWTRSFPVEVDLRLRCARHPAEPIPAKFVVAVSAGGTATTTYTFDGRRLPLLRHLGAVLVPLGYVAANPEELVGRPRGTLGTRAVTLPVSSAEAVVAMVREELARIRLVVDGVRGGAREPRQTS